MRSEEIVEAVQDALRRASAPICYVHEDGTKGAFAAIIETPLLRRIVDMIPEEREGELTDVVMNHGHVEGDEDAL